MGLQIDFNPSASATHAGMGGWAGPGGGAPPGFALGGSTGYNPAIVAAHQAVNTPAVNTGNNFAPGAFNPFNKNPYNIDNITQPAPGFVSTLTGPEFFSLQPGQFNPFNNSPYNIDNITTPAVVPFGGYPNQTGVSNAPWINPFGSLFGGTGWTQQSGPDN
tara:strand:- start:546 stop:1028 length:483 start_codon:yes stop_codon:yes gene_type:complete